MKRIHLALSLLAAFVLAGVGVSQEIIPIKPAPKKSAPKRARPKPKPQPKPFPAPTKRAEVVAPVNATKNAALNTSGLKEADFFRYVHDGRFTRINRDNLRFRTAVESYITSFSNRCQSSLSKDKKEITKYVETYRTETTFLPWGRVLVPMTSQRLESSGYVGTGIYAEPAFADLYVKIAAENMQYFMRNIRGSDLQSLANSMLENASDVIEISTQTYSDMNALLVNNGCDSAATKRFGENLLRFSNGQQSVQAANGEKSYFERACAVKLPKLFPKSSPNACGCIDRELSAALHPSYISQLEDEFDAQDFNVFLLYSVSKAGLQQKVSACIGNQSVIK